MTKKNLQEGKVYQNCSGKKRKILSKDMFDIEYTDTKTGKGNWVLIDSFMKWLRT